MTKNPIIFLLSLVFTFSWLTSNSQSDPQRGHGKISGTIVDASTQGPVEFATVALTNPQTGKPVDGTVCDENGRFIIEKVANGTYKLVISFIGYENVTRDIEVTDNKSTVLLGTLKLNASVTQLNEVVVEGERSLIEEKVDRMIYNAEHDATTRGGDAADVLRRVPMLSVDLDGNVSLRGNQNILVLINNKPSTITASSVADALQQIPADQIKSVEVITSPSARYDAEGSAGIVNIITKKNNLQGFTLNLDGNVGLRGSHLGINGNLRTGKMGFSVGGWGRGNYNVTGSYLNNQTTISTLDGVDTETKNVQSANTLNQGLFGNYRFGWDYDMNKYNSLQASVRFGTRTFYNEQNDLLTESFVNDALIRNSLRDVTSSNLSGNVEAEIDYTRTFDESGKEFSMEVELGRDNRTNDFVNTILMENDIEAISRIKNNNDSYNQDFSFRADYQTPIGKTQIFEIGGKNTSRKVSSDYQYFRAAGIDGEYVQDLNTSLSNNLKYDQNVAGGYASYTINLPRSYALKAGGRYEYTTIQASYKDEVEIQIPSYGIFVPSANLSKKLKSGTLKAAYNRRIRRPSLQYLNPNIQGSNPLNITYGDPYLSPEFTNNYEISYSNYFKGSSINISAFVRNTNNAIQSIRDVVGKDTIRTTYRNIGQEDAYGTSIFANVSISEKFMLNGGGDLYYAVLNNNNPDPIYNASNSGWVVSGRIFGNYNFTKTWGLQFFSFVRGREVQLQGLRGGFGMYSLSLKKDFKDKKGSIGFGAENFFNINGLTVRNESTSPILIQRNTNVMNNMSFKVNFNIRLGKMKFDDRPRGRNESDRNEDLKQGNDNNGMIEGGGQGEGGQGGGGGNFGGQRGGGPGGRPAMGRPQVNTNIAVSDLKATANAEGTWTYTVESPQGGGGTLVIRRDGETLAGTIVNNRFNREYPLKTITLTGNELNFSYDTNFGGNTSSIVVKAVIQDDGLSGTMNVGQYGSFPIKATRNK